ncbi:MAG: CusA/CzcA family heavy metal efflux RND transporter [Flavobacteriales bacterium]|nr:CusA/CzcA family heavy metal efflux RND transporter [Flavobacteriales bacterium]
MIERIIRYSIRHKATVILGALLLLIGGIMAFRTLPVDAVPDITNNQVQVITLAPSLATLEVERFVSYPVEQALASLPRQVELRSISRFGLSQVTIVFEDGMDGYLARQLVGERLQGLAMHMPAGVEQPFLAPMTTGLGEVFQYVVRADSAHRSSYDAMELRELQDWVIGRQLLGVPGVAEINGFGGELKQFEVAADPVRLQSMGLGLGDLIDALERNNANTGGAYIEHANNAYFIRGVGLATGMRDIGRIVVDTPQEGAPVVVDDVATVRLGAAPRFGAMTRDGEGEVVGGIVMMLKGGNAAEVVEAVKTRLDEIRKGLPEGIVIEPFLDRADLVGRAMRTVRNNLVEGAIIVIMVLVLFLGQLRAGLIVASVIPLSMLFAIILMRLTGVSGNLMSLGAIDFGLVVDGAVIIVEAVLYRMHHLPRRDGLLSRTEMDGQVEHAASRMMSAATFGQLIILIVYIPILALSGVEGKMFRPMALTVVYAIVGAIVLSLTYVPVMSALFVPRRTGPTVSVSDRFMERLARAYRPTLERALRYRTTVLGVSIVLLGAAVFAFTRMGGEFLPQLEEGDFAYHSILPEGASLQASIANNARVERILKGFPEVKDVVSKTGTAEVPTDIMSPEMTDVMVLLHDKSEWTTGRRYWQLADTMLAALRVIPGVFFEINQPIQMRTNELMTGVRQDIAVKLYGPDIDTLLRYADDVAAVIREVPGARPPSIERVAGTPQITIRYDRERLAALGCDVEELNRSVRAAFAGEPAGSVYEGERRFDVVVRADSAHRSSMADVRSLFVRARNGTLLPLSQVADIDFMPAPAQITHENAQRRIYVGVNAHGRDVEGLVGEISARVEERLKLPPGYFLRYGGQFQNLREAKARLSIALPVALALILVLLWSTFRSLPDALLIYTAVPLSAIGGVAGLLLRGMPFSISAGVGFIALFGVAVLNGMVLVGTFRELAAQGVDDAMERVRRGTAARLRPVLMTAAVASLGFLPMALSHGAGAEVQRPLATVVIGGLITATLLTLVVLPAMYVMYHDRRGRRRASKAAPAALLLLLAVPAAQAQVPAYSLEEALRLSAASSPQVLAAQAEAERMSALRGAAGEVPRTEVLYTRGQYNAYVKDDNNLTITQALPFPTLMAARAKAARAEEELALAHLARTESDLAWQVRKAWHQLQYLYALGRLLEREDSTWAEIARSVEARARAGDASPLEQATARVRAGRSHDELRRHRHAVDAERIAFGVLLGLATPADAAPAPFVPSPYAIPDTAHPMGPDLLVFQQREASAHAQRRVERQAFMPDLVLGYFNQTLIGAPLDAEGVRLATRSDRFQGIQLGVALPLWARPQAARTKAAGLQEQAARHALAEGARRWRTEVGAAMQRIDADRATLEWYEAEALPNAEAIIAASRTAYAAGAIAQAEHAINVQQALAVHRSRLDLIAAHNADILLVQRLIAIP